MDAPDAIDRALMYLRRAGLHRDEGWTDDERARLRALWPQLVEDYCAEARRERNRQRMRDVRARQRTPGD